LGGGVVAHRVGRAVHGLALELAAVGRGDDRARLRVKVDAVGAGVCDRSCGGLHVIRGCPGAGLGQSIFAIASQPLARLISVHARSPAGACAGSGAGRGGLTITGGRPCCGSAGGSAGRGGFDTTVVVGWFPAWARAAEWTTCSRRGRPRA